MARYRWPLRASRAGPRGAIVSESRQRHANAARAHRTHSQVSQSEDTYSSYCVLLCVQVVSHVTFTALVITHTQ